MADELPEGHMQLGVSWANVGAPEGTATTGRRSRATSTPVVEPAEETEESTEEEAEEDSSNGEDDDDEDDEDDEDEE